MGAVEPALLSSLMLWPISNFFFSCLGKFNFVMGSKRRRRRSGPWSTNLPGDITICERCVFETAFLAPFLTASRKAPPYSHSRQFDVIYLCRLLVGGLEQQPLICVRTRRAGSVSATSAAAPHQHHRLPAASQTLRHRHRPNKPSLH